MSNNYSKNEVDKVDGMSVVLRITSIIMSASIILNTNALANIGNKNNSENNTISASDIVKRPLLATQLDEKLESIQNENDKVAEIIEIINNYMIEEENASDGEPGFLYKALKDKGIDRASEENFKKILDIIKRYAIILESENSMSISYDENDEIILGTDGNFYLYKESTSDINKVTNIEYLQNDQSDASTFFNARIVFEDGSMADISISHKEYKKLSEHFDGKMIRTMKPDELEK